MRQLFKKLFSKIIVCPNCGQRSRVPLKPGKVLCVTCPACQHNFEIQFSEPKDLLSNAMRSSSLTGKQQSQLQRYMPIIMGVLVLLMMKQCFVSVPNSSDAEAGRYKSPVQTQSQSNNQVFDL